MRWYDSEIFNWSEDSKVYWQWQGQRNGPIDHPPTQWMHDVNSLYVSSYLDGVDLSWFVSSMAATLFSDEGDDNTVALVIRFSIFFNSPILRSADRMRPVYKKCTFHISSYFSY